MCQPDTLRKRTRVTSTDIAAEAPEKRVATEGYALTRKVVSHHSAANDAWVIYKGGVYDITLFLETHPGGADIVLDKLGGDVTEIMSGGSGGPGALHQHSTFAYKLLARYKIGELVDADEGVVALDGNIDPVTGDPLVRWGRPILHQIGMLGDKYDRWIHSFPTTDHTVKMFENDLVENLTKCPWYVPLVFWLPIIAYECARYFRLIGGVGNASVAVIAPMMVVGFVSWLLLEYTLHRYVFHMPTKGYYSNIFHFLIHGHHHITPMDFDRLVFPPLPALLIAAPFWYGGPKLFGVQAGYPWMIGMAFGYLVYDMTHFWIHHGVPKNAWLKMQKRRHVHHHYFQPSVNFGISNPLFDVVFGTLYKSQE